MAILPKRTSGFQAVRLLFHAKESDVDIIGGMAAAGNALQIAKTLRQIDKGFDSATLRAKIAELIEALSDTKLALVEAREAMADQETEIARLKAAFQEHRLLVSGEGDYKFVLNDQGERAGYPVCPRCESLDGRIIQLKQSVQLDAGKCPACATEYRPVACYIPASKNNGAETTVAAEYRAREKARSEERKRRWDRLNSDDSWMSR